MKYLLALLGITLIAAGCSSQTTNIQTFEQFIGEDLLNPKTYLVDQTGILSESTKLVVNKELEDFNKDAQIFVVVTKTTGRYSIEEYTVKLANLYKVGSDEKDNGVVFVIASSDRKVRLEIGKGLESVIPDGKAGRILDECVIPKLKANNYDEAVLGGVACIKKEIK